MSIILRIIGGIWALIGAGNIFYMDWDVESQGLLILGCIFNMLIFVIPGLIVYGIGEIMKSRKIARQQVVMLDEKDSTESRLAKLDELKEKGLITEAEHETRRDEVINEIIKTLKAKAGELEEQQTRQ